MAFDYGKAFGLAGDLLTGIGDYQSGLSTAGALQKQAAATRARAGGILIGREASLANAQRSREEGLLSSRSNAIELMKLREQTETALGGQRADIAASGLTEGSALDVIRQSHRNASLDAALLSQQGQITASGYAGQASNYEAQAKSATAEAQGQELNAQAFEAQAAAQKKKSSGGFFGSLLKIGAGIASLIP